MRVRGVVFRFGGNDKTFDVFPEGVTPPEQCAQCKHDGCLPGVQVDGQEDSEHGENISYCECVKKDVVVNGQVAGNLENRRFREDTKCKQGEKHAVLIL